MFWDFGSLFLEALRRLWCRPLRQRHSAPVKTLRRQCVSAVAAQKTGPLFFFSRRTRHHDSQVHVCAYRHTGPPILRDAAFTCQDRSVDDTAGSRMGSAKWTWIGPPQSLDWHSGSRRATSGHFAFPSSCSVLFSNFFSPGVFHGMDFPGKSEGRISLGQGWRVWTGSRVPGVLCGSADALKTSSVTLWQSRSVLFILI